MPSEKKFPTKFPGYYVSKDGSIWRETPEGDIIRQSEFLRGGDTGNRKNYKSFNISLKDSQGKTLKQLKYYSHRLIAETLIDNPSNLSEVDHINRDKMCNSVNNLRWVDRKTNRNNR